MAESAILKKWVDGAPEDDARQKGPRDHQLTKRRFNIEFRYKCGRKHDGISCAVYNRHFWHDNGREETLILVFHGHERPVIVTLRGHYLRRITDQIKDEKCEFVQEVDESKALLLMRENREIPEPKVREEVVTSIEVQPSVQDLIDNLEGEMQ